MSIIRRTRTPGFPKGIRFLRRFRRSTSATATESNRIHLHQDGGDFFRSFFAGLRRAQTSICLEFYIVRDDKIGRELAVLLTDAVGRGVKVALIYDYIGCFDTPASYFRALEKAGVDCLSFNPPSFRRGIRWLDKRDHRKIAIIDGDLAFAGGLNIGSEYSGYGESQERWRDMGVSVQGPAAVELQRLFCESWQEESGSTLPWFGSVQKAASSCGEAKVHVVSGAPHHNRSYIRNAFRLAMAGAGQSITVANPYFIPGPRVMRSLLKAVHKGVRVRLILPAVNDVPLVKLVSRSYYAQLLKDGIEIFEREGTVLHAKVMLIDGCWSIIGSANLDQRSFHRNYEVNLIVDSCEFGREVESMLDRDLAFSRRVALDEHERRGWFVRFLEKLTAPIKWFL
mgnify:CR=1 FL=1